MQEKEEKVKNFVQMRGPVLLMDIAKNSEIESYLAGAIVSTLVNRGDVKQSFRKIGASPLYFVGGQEDRVRSRLHGELNDLEKKALSRIKELKVAFNEELYPQERYLMGDLKDFVERIKIKEKGQEFVCWRLKSLEDDEFESIVENKIKKYFPEEQEVSGNIKTEPAPMSEESESAPMSEESKSAPMSEKPETPIPEKSSETPSEKQPKESSQDEKPTKPEKSKKPKKKKRKLAEFESQVVSELSEKDIDLEVRKEIGRNEIDYTSEIETPFGAQKIKIKVLNKKRVSDNALSRIHLEAIETKMPIVVYIPKKLSSKSSEFLKKNLGSLVKVKVIKKEEN